MAEMILLDAPAPGVSDEIFYQVATGVAIRILFVSCNMDGTSCGDDWIPTLEINAPSISTSAYFGQDVLALAGEFLFMTWAPYLSPAPFGRESGTYAQQSGMPDLVLTHNWSLSVGGRRRNSAGFGNADLVLTSLQIAVEQLEGDRRDLAVGPFMLVPGPGAGL